MFNNRIQFRWTEKSHGCRDICLGAFTEFCAIGTEPPRLWMIWFHKLEIALYFDFKWLNREELYRLEIY